MTLTTKCKHAPALSTCTLLFSTLLSSQSLSAVNMKDASFSKSFRDFSELERTYNSRSLHDGIFGFGWCSDFEKKLDFSNSQEIRMKDCSQPADTVYKNMISGDGELLKHSQNKYIIQRNKTRWVFNEMGQLVSLSIGRASRDEKTTELSYDSLGLLRKVVINQNIIYRFNYEYARRKVAEVKSSQGKAQHYLYEGQNLISSGAKAKVSTYSYDSLHNLIQIRYPDQTSDQINYDTDNDRVTSLQTANSCLERYQYSQKENYLQSALERICNAKTIAKINFEFFEKKRADGLNYLDKLRISNGSMTKEITYDAFSGVAKKISLKNAIRMAASRELYE